MVKIHFKVLFNPYNTPKALERVVEALTCKFLTLKHMEILSKRVYGHERGLIGRKLQKPLQNIKKMHVKS